VTSRQKRGVLALVSALALAAFGAVPPVSTSAVATEASVVSTGAGIDISFPQCIRRSHVDLPTHIPFAVIGVNGGSAFNANPCFSSEYNSAFLLAGATNQPHASVYVNTGNPALAGVWWPSSNHTRVGTAVLNPNGSCDHQPGAECAYVYGYSMAQADFRRVSTTLVVVPATWWLDVETSNTWQSDLVANAASLSGMVDYFESRHLDVGLYSTSYQWNKIAGATAATSNLAGLPSWLAGASFLGAANDCERSPLTPNGRVAMVQYVTRFDDDYSCARFPVTTAAISPASPLLVGRDLTGVSGNWGATDVSYSYQWNRNGSAIAGATSKSYTPTALDAGCIITVTISGSAPGYSSASQTSDGVAVLSIPTPESVTQPG
jgi:hypothetical protein